MTATAGASKGEQALATLTELARGSVHAPTNTQLDRGLEVLSARMAGERTRQRSVVRWSLAAATAVVCVAAGLGAYQHWRGKLSSATPPALTYHIEGGTLVAGGYLRDSGRSGIKVSFNEGTELVLMPGTRGRLRSVDASGARIAIEHGTASFQVVPRQDRKWLVDVGPFLVTVKGTVFSVSWDAGSERFELRLRHGRVTVSGPISGGDITLQAGQRLVVDLPKAETLITEQNPEDAWDAPTVGAVAPPAGSPSERPAPPHERPAKAGAAATVRPDRERHWAEALAAGQLDRILAEAERTGVKATLEKASSDDLFALADAARYRRRTELAREALLAERRRFPASSRALDSAYFLGRVEEASERGIHRAVAWYDEYLLRAPTGTYAAEALGRKMTLTNKLAGPEQARPLAEEYLRRFPNGSYAGSARALKRVH